MEQKVRISQFMDADGKIKQLPRKQKERRAVLEYLADKIEPDCNFCEQQINSICSSWITFGDYFIVRRELVDNGLLGREPDGSKYWRIPVAKTE